MEISVIICCLLLSTFFSGMKVAFASSNKVYLEMEKLKDNYISKTLAKLIREPSKFIVTMLIGNSIFFVIFVFMMTRLLINVPQQTFFSQFFHSVVLTFAVYFFTAGFISKVIFQIYANTIMKILALPTYFFYVPLSYLSSFVIGLSNVIMKKIFRVEKDKEPLFFSKTELENYISEQVNAVADSEKVDSEIQIFQNALGFSEVKAHDIMKLRTEIAAVEINDSVKDLKQKFIETGYSKILVYQNSLDDIVGYIHSFELFKNPKNIQSVMNPVEYVPETMFIKDIMNTLTKKRKSVAVVFDEYGGTSGMITTEDIVEELFGEIEDEHDKDEHYVEEVINENCFRFSARLEVEYLNNTYKFELPQDDSYSTLGGLIVNRTNEIPKKSEEIEIENFHFIIEEATSSKINQIIMTVKTSSDK